MRNNRSRMSPSP